MACVTPYYVDNPKSFVPGQHSKLPVPCGRCLDCLSLKANQWAFRIQKEADISASCYFVTLTYDTFHVPISDLGLMTLDKSDFQKFMKRFRKRHVPTVSSSPVAPLPIRYYAVGEYGTQSMRPHYHAIIFNCDPDLIPDAWTLGGIDVGTVTAGSINYVVKYLHKNTRIPVFDGDDRQKEFSLMSKGLGSSYMTPAMVRWHKADVSRNYFTLPGGIKVPLPRYYRDKIYDDAAKELQRDLIESVVAEDERLLRDRFHRIYGEDADFDCYLDNITRGKNDKLYKKNLFTKRSKL